MKKHRNGKANEWKIKTWRLKIKQMEENIEKRKRK